MVPCLFGTACGAVKGGGSPARYPGHLVFSGKNLKMDGAIHRVS